jgi:hypothetical protein
MNAPLCPTGTVWTRCRRPLQQVVLALLLASAWQALLLPSWALWPWASPPPPSYASQPHPLLSHTYAQLGLPAFGPQEGLQWLAHSRDPLLLQSLACLQHSPLGQESLAALRKGHARLLFRVLEELDPQYKDYDALSWMGPEGEWLIFIHAKHLQAPPPALAALIAHEALHNDLENSLQEESVAWQREAMVWLELKRQWPLLQGLVATPPRTVATSPVAGQAMAQHSTALLHRLQRISQAYLQGKLAALVKQHPGYQHLPATSLGFADGSAPPPASPPATSSALPSAAAGAYTGRAQPSSLLSSPLADSYFTWPSPSSSFNTVP